MSRAIPLNSQQQAERATLAYRCSKSLSALKQQQQSKPKPVEYYAKPATSNSQVSAERQALEIRAENSRRAMEVAKMFDYDAQVKSFPNVSMVSQPFDYEALVSSVDSLNAINMEKENGICQLNLTSIGCSPSSVSQIMGALQDYEVLVLNTFFQNFVTWLKLNSTPPIQPLVFVNLVKRYIADKVPDISTFLMNALNEANGGIGTPPMNNGRNGGDGGANDGENYTSVVPIGRPPDNNDRMSDRDAKQLRELRKDPLSRGNPKDATDLYKLSAPPIPDWIKKHNRLEVKESNKKNKVYLLTNDETPAPKPPSTKKKSTQQLTPTSSPQQKNPDAPTKNSATLQLERQDNAPTVEKTQTATSVSTSWKPIYEIFAEETTNFPPVPQKETTQSFIDQINIIFADKDVENAYIRYVKNDAQIQYNDGKLSSRINGSIQANPLDYMQKKGKADYWKKLKYVEYLRREYSKSPLKGKGLQKKRIIKGKGSEHLCNNGRGIDLDKLKQNILRIANTKTNKANKFQPFAITDDAKEVITDLINDKFDERYYKKLHPDDQSAVKHAIIGLGLKHPITKGHIKQLYADWEIARGEICSGNDNPQLRTQLKKLTIELQHLRRIPVGVAKQVLDELA
jgi:hypothetical protein